MGRGPFEVGGIRIVPMVAQNFSVSLTWSTLLTKSLTTEERRSLGGSKPLVGISASSKMADLPMVSALIDAQRQTSYLTMVPYWPDKITPQNLVLEPPYKLINGSNVILYRGSSWCVASCALSGNTITSLTLVGADPDNVFSNWADGYPLITGTITSMESSPNKLYPELSYTFQEINLPYWGGEFSIPPILTQRPVQSAGGFNSNFSLTQSQSAGLFTSSLRLGSKPVFSMNWGVDSQSKGDYIDLMRTLFYMQGRFRSFAMASYHQDFYSYATYASGVSTIFLTKSGSTINPPQNLLFLNANGDTQARTCTVLSTNADGYLVSLSSPLFFPIYEQTLVSNIYNMRLDSDVHTITFGRLHSFQFSADMVEVL